MCFNTQLIQTHAETGWSYSCSCAISPWPALSSRNPNHTLIHKLQTKSPLWFGRTWTATANWRYSGTARRQLEGNLAEVGVDACTQKTVLHIYSLTNRAAGAQTYCIHVNNRQE